MIQERHTKTEMAKHISEFNSQSNTCEVEPSMQLFIHIRQLLQEFCRIENRR